MLHKCALVISFDYLRFAGLCFVCLGVYHRLTLSVLYKDRSPKTLGTVLRLLCSHHPRQWRVH